MHDGGVRIAEELEDLADALPVRRAVLGRRDPAGRPDEERDPERGLEARDPSADRRFALAGDLRDSAERPEIAREREGAQIVEIADACLMVDDAGLRARH